MNKDLREVWNMLNVRKEALCSEIVHLETIMHLLEKRMKIKHSKRVFVPSDDLENGGEAVL